MKNNLRHERMVKKTVTILFCGLFCIGGINAYADTPLNKALDVQQQDKKVVKGTILDEMGEPIPGANIVVKGTTAGTISNSDGFFSLALPNQDATLIISFIGYKNVVIQVGEKSDLRITMEPEAEQLNEVVVTALGIKREKKALGYAMQEVKTDALIENKSISVANMLQK